MGEQKKRLSPNKTTLQLAGTMKKCILAMIPLLCVALLLPGCLTQIPDTTVATQQTAPPETTLPPEQPGVPLLDQGKTTGESGNLLYIPNPHVESMTSPQIRLYGNGLLLYEYTAGGMMLKRISLEDGCLVAEASHPVSPSTQVQIGNGQIGLCDSSTGQVLILNEFLELETTYAVSQEGEYWFLNQEMETLYIFCFEEGLLTWDLATGQTQWLLENAAFVQPFGVGNSYVLFSYTDREDQKSYNRCLNLSAAMLETVPVEGLISSGSRSGELWLLRQSADSGEYILATEDAAGTFTRTEGLATLLSGRRQLLVTDKTYRNIYLYDLQGNFLSRCALTQSQPASVGTDFVWSGYWQGYFFRDTYGKAAHLMFWNVETSQEGENLEILPVGSVQSPEPVMEKSLYQKAKDLSQRFGLDIRIAEQCSLEYSHYEADTLADPTFVRAALDTLENALSAYPAGFFRQLPYGNLTQIRIELVSNLRGKENMDTHPADIGGFAQSMPDHYLMVLDGGALSSETVYHEISHIIDKRLEWDAMLRSDALFSEDTWLSLQPKGFRYAESYTNIPSDLKAFENSGYFASSYAMTFPTEDRATLMALAMTDSAALKGNAAMAQKMRYYAQCIRDCFDTEGWPAKTLWEGK